MSTAIETIPGTGLGASSTSAGSNCIPEASPAATAATSVGNITSATNSTGTSTNDWIIPCEEVAESTATEVALILRNQFPQLTQLSNTSLNGKF